jgi:hypothetical protein
MQEKETAARHLIAQGLTNRQISVQLRCSIPFVRGVRAKQQRDGEGSAEGEEARPVLGHVSRD